MIDGGSVISLGGRVLASVSYAGQEISPQYSCREVVGSSRPFTLNISQAILENGPK